MNFLIISQVFWPDTVSTAQHLFDLSEELVLEGHQVTVYCSRFAYEDNKVKFPATENYHNIRIFRINNSGFGKKHTIGRLIDFASYNFLLFLKLLFLKKRAFDAMIGMTSPPLVSFIGLFWAKKKKIKFNYWVMDLQPELAIASGMVRKGSLAARFMQKVGNYIIRNADSIIVLDKYMHDYLVKYRGIRDNIHIVPVWSIIEKPYNGNRKENQFRLEHKFGERIVVMYSGNHSHVHPLNTLLQAILRLKDDPNFVFVFIGEGVRKREVTNFVNQYQLANVIQLPYQPRDNIHNSLGSSDLQVVIMGEKQVGYTHPNKIYGAMFIGKPILYIGPYPSHITDIIGQIGGNICVSHDQVTELVQKLISFKSKEEAERINIGNQNYKVASQNFDADKLKSQMVGILTTY